MSATEWDLLTEGETYRFCLLRIDIVDSTRISKASSTEATQKTLARFFKDLEDRVEKVQGRLWSRDGDGALAVFHAQRSALMAENAVTVAVATVNALESFNSANNSMAEAISIRAAVHLGSLPYSKAPGTIASDDINFVTKLEKNGTARDSISISDSVYRELSDEFKHDFGSLSRFGDVNVWSPGVRRTGEAYILLEVEPGASETVANELLGLDPVVEYAAAVWGPWDVVARVAINRYEDLLLFIDRLRTDLRHVRRTETWCVRNDQPHFEAKKEAKNLAFVMLRIDPALATPGVVLTDLCRSAEQEGVTIRHVAGVLGPYDIVATVYYQDEKSLRRLVINKFQLNRAVKDTLTIPGIEGMVYLASPAA